MSKFFFVSLIIKCQSCGHDLRNRSDQAQAQVYAEVLTLSLNKRNTMLMDTKIDQRLMQITTPVTVRPGEWLLNRTIIYKTIKVQHCLLSYSCYSI